MTIRSLPLLSALIAAVAVAQPTPPSLLPAPLLKAAGGMLEGGRLTVTLGKERTPVKLQPRQATATGRWGFQTDQPLTVSVTVHQVGRCTVWEVACTNTGQAQQWLELGPELLLKRAGPLNVFDGWDDFADPQELVSSDRLRGNMPLTCALNDQTTLAVGLEPSQLASYFRHEFEPLADAKARLATLTRIVLDPGQSETVRFVTLTAPGEWGKYEAFEAYYDSFPSFFVARPDVDPRASLGSAIYSAWPASNWSPEVTRRLYGGWDWCYAPFRRTGDIVGRPELWDYTPARPMDKTRSLPRDQYLKWRAERFADGAKRCDVGMMFYIPSQVWCEETLAREHYADALTTDPKAKVYFDTPWVTGHDNELRVFPHLTTFGEQSLRDLAEVARDLDISGFAFDTAGDGCRYLGPALPKLPHRAWDDQVGVYCDESIAVTALMDYVHTLKRDGRTLAVVANPMSYGTFASCAHCDSAMLEANPWTGTRESGDRLRWKMGHKTLVWWEGYGLEDFVDPDTVTKDQLTRVYQGLADFTLLQSLRVGYIPPPLFTNGIARLVRWLPAIVECVQTGWQPVPAARVPEPLWSSRYGTGLSTILAVAHETGQLVNGDVTVENKRLGGNVLLFSGYDGAEMTNRLVQGETVIPLNVPVRTPVLLRAQLAVAPGAKLSQAKVSEEIGIASHVLTADLSGAGPATIGLRVPVGMPIASVTVDGKAVICTPAGDIKLTLKPQTKLVVSFASKLFAVKDSALLDFPFIRDGKPNVTLVIPKNASETTRHAAFRLQEYFRYWTGHVQQPPAEVLLPIVEEGAAVHGAMVRFSLTPGKPARVAFDRANLVISAPDDQALLAATFQLLRALDRRYWFPGRLPATVLNRRVGLAGTVVE
ncbi:MAG: hypothetical protein KKI08_26950 [Armatimonadetes bacterium]|nr:hypothetical protein [Armatimonadota bacterium]